MNISSFIADNWYWIVAAAASGGMLLWQQVKSGGVGGGVTPAQAVQLINKQKAQVIDVCEPAEFAAAHVTGAKNIPLGQLGQGKGLPSNQHHLRGHGRQEGLQRLLIERRFVVWQYRSRVRHRASTLKPI